MILKVIILESKLCSLVYYDPLCFWSLTLLHDQHQLMNIKPINYIFFFCKSGAYQNSSNFQNSVHIW